MKIYTNFKNNSGYLESFYLLLFVKFYLIFRIDIFFWISSTFNYLDIELFNLAQV